MSLPTIRKQYAVSVHAHRGYNAKYPENTLLAFERAIETGADYIELDVHTTTDGKIIVIHDGTTGRVGSPDLDVEKSTFEEVRAVTMEEGQKIPTLEEVCELCKGKIGINIEIKQENIYEQVNQIIQKFGMESDVMISSFLHEEIRKFKKLNPKLLFATLEPTGSNILQYLLSALHKSKFIAGAVDVGAQGINPHYRFVTAKFCRQAHAKGQLVSPWTPNSPKFWEKLIVAGVDSIITNDPEGLIAYLKSRE